MGVDVTIFLEYWEGDAGESPWGTNNDPNTVIWDKTGIQSFGRGPMGVGRNYQLHGALAGIRSRLNPLYPPRGLPPTISGAVARRVMRYIHADDVPRDEVLASDGVYYSASVEMVARGVKYGGPLKFKRYDYVVTEELYSSSWLYLDEVERALAHHSISGDGPNFLFAAMMSAMRSLESYLGHHRTRLVFWFDGS